MRTGHQSSPPEVAIIGAGLAGLSAGLALRAHAKHARVSIFEKEPRIGGRVLTSHRPRGEHGAEFVLRSESVILKLLRLLGLSTSTPVKDSACRFERHPGCGSFITMARHTLNAGSREAVIRVLQAAEKANRSDRYPKADKPGQWLNQRLQNDRRSRRFLQMLLAGETCAPWNHLTGRHALGSLDESETYRIAGGSGQLVQALRRAIPEARLVTGAKVTSVRIDGARASVRWRQDTHQYRAPFDAVIITAPHGERLLRQWRVRHQSSGHFHAYVSVLLVSARGPTRASSISRTRSCRWTRTGAAPVVDRAIPERSALRARPTSSRMALPPDGDRTTRLRRGPVARRQQ